MGSVIAIEKVASPPPLEGRPKTHPCKRLCRMCGCVFGFLPLPLIRAGVGDHDSNAMTQRRDYFRRGKLNLKQAGFDGISYVHVFDFIFRHNKKQRGACIASTV